MLPNVRRKAGHYAAAAEQITAIGEEIVERAAVEPGMEVLDVACGAGNATIPAARAGARVTGLEPSPDLLAVARERAADAMVEVEWVEAHTQDMPFEDGSFDRVVSTFGHMFAPDQHRTAEEMKRVCREGGAIAVACWRPDGAIGRMLPVITELSPPPTLWGTEEHVTGLLGEAEFEWRELEWRDESVESYAHFLLESLGRLLKAPQPELDARVRSFLAEENLNDDGTLRFLAEYLVAVVRKHPARPGAQR
jgi:ubiquinone/menaquinone biosynthesis C-methylase UbiE